MKILICGDSFAADWSIKYHDYLGWPNILAEEHEVTNLAEAGVSEYKIWLQLTSADLKKFDSVIIWHTSPYRIPVEQHPDHYSDRLHKNCDFLYSDVKNSNNIDLKCVTEYYERFYHKEYADFVYDLIIDKQREYMYELFKGQVLHVSVHQLNNLEFISFEKLFNKQCGKINHFSKQGNIEVYKELSKWLI